MPRPAGVCPGEAVVVFGSGVLAGLSPESVRRGRGAPGSVGHGDVAVGPGSAGLRRARGCRRGAWERRAPSGTGMSPWGLGAPGSSPAGGPGRVREPGELSRMAVTILDEHQCVDGAGGED